MAENNPSKADTKKAISKILFQILRCVFFCKKPEWCKIAVIVYNKRVVASI